MRKTLLLSVILFIALAVSVHASILSDDLLASYNMNGNGDMIDIVHGYNLTMYGMINVGTGIINDSRGTYSNSDYFSSTTSCPPNLDYDKDFSISAWFNITDWASDWQTIFQFGTGIYDNLARVQYTDGAIQLYTETSGVGVNIGTAYTNQWHLIVFTYNGTGDRKLRGYIDNSTVYVSVTSGTSFMSGNSCTAGISSSGQSFTNGYIDEVNVWNRTLSDDDASELYNLGSYPIYNASMPCIEDWQEYNMTCVNDVLTKYYFDEESCGTINSIPSDNGTTTFCGNATNNLLNGLVWYYPFEESQPSNAYSSLDNLTAYYYSNSGNAISSSAGIIGSGISFNPTLSNPYTNYLTITDKPLDLGISDFTLSLWFMDEWNSSDGTNGRIFRLESYNGTLYGIATFLEVGTTRTGINPNYYRTSTFRIQSPDYNICGNSSNGAFYYIIQDNPINNAWHNIVITRNNTVFSIYQDNILYNTFTCDFNASTGTTSLNTQGVDTIPYPILISINPEYEIGMSLNGSGRFNGSIDELGFWNRTLNIDEVSLLNKKIPYDDFNITPTCTENWIGYDSACINGNQTLQYYDQNNCETYNDVPIDNGTVTSCIAVTPTPPFHINSVDTSTTINFMTYFLALILVIAIFGGLYLGFIGKNELDEQTTKYLAYIIVAVIIIVMIVFMTAIL